MLPGECVDRWHVGQAPVQVHRHDHPGARGQRLRQVVRAQVEAGLIGLHQHRHQLVLGNREDGGNISVGRYQHLITLGDAAQLFPGTQGQYQRVQAVGHANAVLYSAVTGELGFELLELFAHDVPARVDNLGAGINQCLTVLRIHTLQIEKLNHCGLSP
ncbi:hypothetical protein D3C79_691240 [compost metagenome]